MNSFNDVKEALTPALAEILEIGEESFDNLCEDIKDLLGGDKKRPRASIDTFISNLTIVSQAAVAATMLGQTEKAERLLKSMAGTLNTYQVIAANKAINEAYAAWRKVLMVVISVIKEVGPIALEAIAGPVAGAVAKSVASGGDGGGSDEGPSLADLVTAALKTVTDAENNLVAAEKSKDKKRISTAKGRETKARKALAGAEENLANAGNA